METKTDRTTSRIMIGAKPQILLGILLMTRWNGCALETRHTSKAGWNRRTPLTLKSIHMAGNTSIKPPCAVANSVIFGIWQENGMMIHRIELIINFKDQNLNSKFPVLVLVAGITPIKINTWKNLDNWIGALIFFIVCLMIFYTPLRRLQQPTVAAMFVLKRAA